MQREFVIDMNPHDLLREYHSLPTLEQAVVRLVSLVYAGTGAKNLLKCLQRLPYLSQAERNMEIGQLRKVLALLKRKRMIGPKQECPPDLAHAISTDACDSGYIKQYIAAIESVCKETGRRVFYGYSVNENMIYLSELRRAIYGGDELEIIEQLETIVNDIDHHGLDRLFMYIYADTPLNLKWLLGLPFVVQQRIFSTKLRSFCLTGWDFDQLQPLLSHYESKREDKNYRSFATTFLLYDILSGRTDCIEQTLAMSELPAEMESAVAGTAAFFLQNQKMSLTRYAEGLKSLRKQTHSREIYFRTIDGVFYLLALLQTEDKKHWDKLQAHLKVVLEYNTPYSTAYRIIQDILWVLRNQEDLMQKNRYSRDIGRLDLAELDPLSAAIRVLYCYWFDKDKLDLEVCRGQFITYKNSLPLVAKIFVDVLVQSGQSSQNSQEYEIFISQNNLENIIDFSSIVKVSEKWERQLQQLNHFFECIGGSGDSSKKKRLVWRLNPEDIQSLTAIAQSLKLNGTWSKGKKISRKRLFENGSSAALDYLTLEDHKLIRTLKKNPYRYYGSEDYYWDQNKTLQALIGHPRIFCETAPDVFSEFVETSPELIIEEDDKDYFKISMSHLSSTAEVLIEQETPSRFRVVDFSEQFLPLTDIIGNQGLKVSASAKEHVVNIIRKAAPILPIQSELESDDLPTVESDPTPCLQMLPMGEGLRANLFVRPFTDSGCYLRPGQGKPLVLSEIKGQHTRARRDLKQEEQLVEQLLESSSCLRLRNDDSNEWIFERPDDCLELLSELQNYQGSLKIEWPEGQTFAVTKQISFNDFSLNIRQQNDWFEVQGELHIGEDKVLDMRTLLDLLESSQGNFIPLGEHQFLSLSKHFKKRLQDLKAFSESTKSGAKVHGLGSLTLQEFASEAGKVKSDKHWKEKLKALAEVESYQPQLPTTLQADLRDYQVEGFEWLARLSKAGMGACLADDMGLGKTLQALAVMLPHASQGPCLVIAPTSVCHNWEDEVRKFSPTLNTHTMPLKGRKERVESLGPNDVLVCSYGIMQQSAEILQEKFWQMVVLDEAQAIKNPATKRSQVVGKLQGQFKLALTGTPIENNLDELWSLFRFVAPGLLGSRESFRSRFSIPIQKHGKKQVQNALRLLVQTFILRRTKNKVLTELPPRTEQTLVVEMTEEERSFYEALRRKAVERIQALDEDTQAGQKRFHILAEMTRLRQACCHPQLITAGVAVKSSKMKMLLRLIDDLKQNNHQALIFSQYVSYLKLVRKELDDQGISYRYLDGSTPASARKQEVHAFQSGESDLFLISLKAGGAGLNLTAADYVIHLDPWWNPAVEDQASDRAHRIGQTRPVTVYRLIMQNSIEEKIISLHQTKRDLADGLLKGSDVWQRLSEDQLIELIQETQTPETQLLPDKQAA